MRRSSALRSIPLLLTLLVGCSTDGSPGAESAFARYESSRDAAYCEGLVCPVVHVYEATFLATLGDEARCRSYVRAGLGTVDPALENALARGTVVLDEEAVEACGEVRRSCGATEEGPCARLLVGTVPAGGSCLLEAECATGHCVIESGASCGVCVTGTAALDEPCDDARDCLPSELGHVICPFGFGDTVCRLEDDRTIVDSAIGGPCDLSVGEHGVARCGTAGYCDENHVCRAPIALGEPCVPDQEACVTGGSCTPSSTDATNRCRPTELVGLDAPCGLGEEGALVCDPLADLRCDPMTSRCVRVGAGTAGSSCNTDVGCDDGLVCAVGAGGDRACIAPAPNGSACASNRQCASRYCEMPEAEALGLCADAPAIDACLAP